MEGHVHSREEGERGCGLVSGSLVRWEVVPGGTKQVQLMLGQQVGVVGLAPVQNSSLVRSLLCEQRCQGSLFGWAFGP
jgi:hypothetical protein